MKKRVVVEPKKKKEAFKLELLAVVVSTVKASSNRMWLGELWRKRKKVYLKNQLGGFSKSTM